MSNGSTFIGRRRELRWVGDRLADPLCRLITLMGPGGIGKTRIALQAAMAAKTSNLFDDGVCVIELASITMPLHLADAIAATLSLSLHGPAEPIHQIIDVLHDRNILLVLDNIEPLLNQDCGAYVAKFLTELLSRAPKCKILVTSRERLHLHEEWAFPLEGLSLITSDINEGGCVESDAVQLFMACARRVDPGWDADSHMTVAREICQYVEGMPLAIEIAAGWLRAMSVEKILAHLKGDLGFLASPVRNLPTRHASLHRVFDSSWSLLSEVERASLAGLAMFRGGFDIEAANAVIDITPHLLAMLIDKSLVCVKPTGRYELHELLRQYVTDKLGADAKNLADRHLAFYTALANEAETALSGPTQIDWFDRFEVEHGNFTAALDYALATGITEAGLGLAGALGWFWQLRMHLREGSHWYAQFLETERLPTVTAAVYAKALHRASELETQLGNSARAYDLAQKAIAIAQANEDRWNLAWGLAALGLWGKHDKMRPEPLEEALALFRDLDDSWGISHTLRRLALFAVHAGDFVRSATLASESLVLARAIGDKSAIAWSLFALAFARWQQVDLRPQAIDWLRESLPVFHETRDANGLAMALDLLSGLEFMSGDITQALAHAEANVSLALERTWTPSLASDNSLAVCILLLWQRGKYSHVATLMPSITQLVDIHQPQSPNFLFGSQLSTLQAQLGLTERSVATFLNHEQLLGEVLRVLDTQDTTPISERTEQPLVEPLSKRELEVLRLLAAGQSNAQVAQALCLSTGTVKVHARNIYGKLGVGNRTQAVAHARELGLI